MDDICDMSEEKTLEEINDYMKNSMVDHLNIRFISFNSEFVSATMPVTEKNRQPYGVLHGGASAALAETVASVGSHMLVAPENKKAFGIEVTAQHLKSVSDGLVTAHAKLIKKGRTLHTWQIDITNEERELVCYAKMIIAIR